MRLRDTLIASISATALVASVLLIGGAFRWTQGVVAGLVAIGVVLTLGSSRALTRTSPLMATLGTAIGVTALQLVPLPHSLLTALQPTGAALRDEGAAIAGVDPWPSLSLDSAGTLRGLCFFIILAGVAALSLRFTVTEKGRFRVLAAVAATCGIAATVTGVHVVFGASSLYGIYTPVDAKPSVLGPLLNENHLGGLMAIGSILAIGLTMYKRQPSWARAIWLVVAGACGAVAVASQSRGATLALMVGALISGAILVAQRLFGPETSRRRSVEQFMTTSLPIAIVAISAVVVVVYASAGAVSAQLSRTSLAELHQPKSKFAVWRTTITLAEESPWVGVGRGAFEPTFTRLHPAAAVASFSHVENEYLQAVVDWGIPGALLVGLGVLWILVTGVRRWRDGPLIAGALGAMAAIGLQSIVDFGVELLGLAIPVTAILATLTYVPLKPVAPPILRRTRVFSGVLVIGLIGSMALLWSPKTRSIQEDHSILADSGLPQLDDIKASLQRHPLDYYGYALAAEAQLRLGQPEAIASLNHALRLHPAHPGLHHLAARLLYQANHRDQAAIEYASAIRSSTQPRALIIEVVSQFNAKGAAAALPVDIARPDDLLNTLLELKHGDVAIAWLRRVLELRPDDRHACEWLFSTAVHDQSVVEARLASAQCTPSTSNATQIGLASILLRNKLYDETRVTLGDVETWTGTRDERLTGWLISCDVHSALGHWDDAKRCLRKLDSSGLVSGERRAEWTRRLEQIEQSMLALPR